MLLLQQALWHPAPGWRAIPRGTSGDHRPKEYEGSWTHLRIGLLSYRKRHLESDTRLLIWRGLNDHRPSQITQPFPDAEQSKPARLFRIVHDLRIKANAFILNDDDHIFAPGANFHLGLAYS